ncbi:MAG TPA: ATP-binding protein [Chloroflexi bacterium]|nr:ATP-binding protein [Chloroflexota bacterium]
MTAFRELSQHILDIFENGAKAGATLISLEIEEDFVIDLLAITLHDNGSGMDAETLARITDPWVTSRTTRKVGLGIPFFKQIAEMCNGDFEIISQLGEGTITRAIFQHSHIDRPPMGDLVGTLTCMIVGYDASADVAYRHRVRPTDEVWHEFTFDTREVRAILGDEVPLSSPEVLAFLREMLQEGLLSLTAEPQG